MTTRAAQYHQSYNPVTHTGSQGQPAEGRAHGLKLATNTATFASSLAGAACIPKAGAPGAFDTAHAALSTAAAGAQQQQQQPARVDHLSGEACRPVEGAGGDSPRGGEAASPKAAKLLTLRAAVDHLSGEACRVRQVETVATMEEPAVAPVVRGIPTKLTRDRRVAQEAKERMNSSRLYSCGKGYTEALAGGGSGGGGTTGAGHASTH